MHNFYFKAWSALIVFMLCLAFGCIVSNADAQIAAKDVEQLDFANGLYQRKLYSMAINEYQKFIDSYVESEYLHEGYLGLAESTFFNKAYLEAIGAYETFLEKYPEDPKSPLARLRLGQAFYLTGKFDLALDQFVEVDPEGLQDSFRRILFFYTGKALQSIGQKDEASAMYEKTLSLNKEGEYAFYSYLEMGNIHRDAKAFEQAFHHYELALRAAHNEEAKALAVYSQAEAHFAAAEFAEAASAFRQVAEQFSGQTIVPEALGNYLLALFSLNSFDEVLQEYQNRQNVILDNNSFFKTHMIAINAYLQKTQYDQALQLVDRVLAFPDIGDDEYAKAGIKKLEILVYSRKYTEALEVINAEYQGNADEKDYILILQAEVYYGQKDFEKAYAIYKRIQNEFPNSSYFPEALYALAHCQNVLNFTKEAAQTFREYFDKGKNQDKRREALYNAILLTTRADDIGQAIELSETYLLRFTEADHRGKVLFHLGTLYPKLDRFEKAAETFQHFAEQFPGSDHFQQALFFVGYYNQQAKHDDEALGYYQKLSKDAAPDLYFSGLENMAYIYLKKEQEGEAAKLFDQIISEYDKNPLQLNTYYWLVQRYIDAGEFQRAVHIIEKAGVQKPEVVKDAGFAYFRGTAHQGLAEYAEAVKYFDQVLASSAKGDYFGAAQVGKGLSLAGLKKYAEAKQEFENALEENSADLTLMMRARFELANVARLSGELEEAAKLYMMVAILYETDEYCPQSLLSAGEIFTQLGQRDEARKAYQEILDKYQNNDLYVEAQKRLEALNAG